jgi:hypothetical protein
VTLELRAASLNPDDIPGRYVVEKETGRMLAGVGHNANRQWTFPLHTPRGFNVLQEYAFDHPFHNGIFVGQGKVHTGDRVAHFWSPWPDWRQPNNHIYRDIGLLQYDRDEPASIDEHNGGFRFTYTTIWRDEQHEPVLDEVRTTEVRDGGDGTIVDVFTSKVATYGPVYYEANKHSTIGVRIQPQLLPFMGGSIIGGYGDRLETGDEHLINGSSADFVAYQSDVPGFGTVGVCLIVLENSAADHRQGPWFVRNYGMAMFNATMTDSIDSTMGETWTAGLRVIAYDDPISLERVANWR